MILRGTIPPAGSRAGRESMTFLNLLMPRGSSYTPEAYRDSCKMLHLAFKKDTTEEIYDTLAFCFLRACRQFDPHHADKVKKVCEVIDGFEPTGDFTVASVDSRVGFDSLRILRALVRKGFLFSLTGKKKVVGYRRAAWPPEPKFFESGPVGFTYVVQTWFRYFLNEYITGKMSELEAGGNMLELDAYHFGDPQFGDGGVAMELAPHAEGNCISSTGHRFMADLGMMEMPLDVSQMTLEWVGSTNDKLFKDLTVQQRNILYLHFVEEMSWREIGKAMSCDSTTVHARFNDIMDIVRFNADLHLALCRCTYCVCP